MPIQIICDPFRTPGSTLTCGPVIAGWLARPSQSIIPGLAVMRQTAIWLSGWVYEHLSSWLAPAPRSPLRSLRELSSILSCTVTPGLGACNGGLCCTTLLVSLASFGTF